MRCTLPSSRQPLSALGTVSQLAVVAAAPHLCACDAVSRTDTVPRATRPHHRDLDGIRCSDHDWWKGIHRILCAFVSGNGRSRHPARGEYSAEEPPKCARGSRPIGIWQKYFKVRHPSEVPLQHATVPHSIDVQGKCLCCDCGFDSQPALCREDFDQVRRTTGLKNNEDIRPNDFVIAMLMRLGQLDPDVVTKCRRLFSKLDRDNNGALNDEDIEELLASIPDTSFIDDKSFDTFHHEVVAAAAASPNLPLSSTKRGDEAAAENPLG